ncbi:MAG: 2-dehydro-3-deoxy-6-phosphogalactonate aldolase [Pseudomonadota bacterium]
MNMLPLVAIYRGVEPREAAAMAGAAHGAGFRILEVPLNSPAPFESIRLIATAFPDALVGAGTVMTAGDVDAVAAAGGTLIVMPHADTEIVRAAKANGLICVPGVATPTEAFAALAAGADGLKVFPAEGIPPAVVKAWSAVIPAHVPMIPVGGIDADAEKMAAYLAAGASGFGLGSALFKPGVSVAQVVRNAESFVAALRAAQA